MAKANVVEHSQNHKTKRNNKLGLKREISKKQKQTKFEAKCFNYDKMGHKVSDYRLPKKK